MWKRSLGRLLRWIPALFLLIAAAFIILKALPGDPVLARLQASGVRVESSESIYQSKFYRQIRQSLGLDQPPFYFTLKPATVPDTLRRIAHPDHRETIRTMCIRFGNTAVVLDWYRAHNQLTKTFLESGLTEAFRACQSIMSTTDFSEQQKIYAWLENSHRHQPSIFQPLKSVKRAHDEIRANSTPLLSYLPAINWHGARNQFHKWLVGSGDRRGILRGDFGVSQRDGRSVLNKVLTAFNTTLTLALLSIVLMYAVALPLGLHLARSKFSRHSKTWTRLLFGLYAIPGFWLGILMLTFLCSSKYLNWFPAAYNLMDLNPQMNWLERIVQTIYHLVLPILCWSLGGIAFLTLQTFRQSKSLEEKPFITAAKAKGISDQTLTFRHIGKNALFPAISLLGSLIPISLSGAIAIELIFSIPGMGQLIFDAFHFRDHNVVMAILILVGLAAILATALSDFILYRVDPRLKTDVQH